jgi:hypothetical protein
MQSVEWEWVVSQVVAEITTEVVSAIVTEERVTAEVVTEVVTVEAGDAVVMALVMNRNVFTPSNGQTAFTLSGAPQNPSVTEMLINGVQARYAIDFMISGALLTWTGPYQLATDDSVEIYFQ